MNPREMKNRRRHLQHQWRSVEHSQRQVSHLETGSPHQQPFFVRWDVDDCLRGWNGFLPNWTQRRRTSSLLLASLPPCPLVPLYQVASKHKDLRSSWLGSFGELVVDNNYFNKSLDICHDSCSFCTAQVAAHTRTCSTVSSVPTNV